MKGEPVLDRRGAGVLSIAVPESGIIKAPNRHRPSDRHEDSIGGPPCRAGVTADSRLSKPRGAA